MSATKARNHQIQYQRFHHHAWAGTVLLTILLSLRIFLEISEITVDDRIFLIVGLALIIYILVALFYTYRYRFDVQKDEMQSSTSAIIYTQRAIELEMDRIKSEKKTAKAEIKMMTKTAKAAAKAKKKKTLKHKLPVYAIQILNKCIPFFEPDCTSC